MLSTTESTATTTEDLTAEAARIALALSEMTDLELLTQYRHTVAQQAATPMLSTKWNMYAMHAMFTERELLKRMAD